MSMLGSKAALLVTTVLFPSIVLFCRAQQTVASCNSTTGYDWAFNSRNQSPCDVASALGGVCLGGTPFGLPPLNATQLYLGPPLANANPCRCNTVFYSLISACAACQGARWLTWTGYSANCTDSQENAPVNIPFGTSVPSWAFINVITTNGFDPAVARNSANGPESTGTPQPTGSNTRSSSISSATRQPSDGGGGGGGGSSNHAGAIAGGVIGGVVGVSLIAGLAFWFVRRRRKSRPRDTWSVDPSLDTANTGHFSPSPTMTSTNFSSTVGGDMTRKLYNPSDPSTFPDALGMQPHVTGQAVTYQTPLSGTQAGHEHQRSLSGGSGTHPGSAATPGHGRNYSGGSYTGTPEI